MAQDTTETVVVTGSRIPQQGLYSTSPVTSVGQQEMKLQGTTNIETILRALPAAEADTDNATTDNGSGGLATVDLRGLGANRTLVLVDGKRLMPSDTGGDVDLSQIPPALVDHVEVLTGGASAVYGSDAIAGVVNIILKKDFEGAMMDAQYSLTDHSDGQTTDLTGVLGFSSANGKGNVTIYGNYEHRNPIFEGDRSYGQHALNDPNFSGCAPGTATLFGGFCAGGSSSSQQGRFSPAAALGGGNYFPTDSSVPGTLSKCGAAGFPACPLFNFAPVNYYQTPNVRYAFGATGHYEVNKELDFYTRLTFSDNQIQSQLAPTPIISTFQTNFGNPFLSGQEKALLFSPGPHANSDLASFGYRRRLVENGNRDDNFDHTSYQMVLGARGDLGNHWNYDVSGQYGRVNDTQRLTGDANFANFSQGLIVDGATPATAVCDDPSGGCVPINIFTQHAISNAAVQFFTLAMDAVEHEEQWDMQGALTGDLGAWGFQSPWAKDPVAVAIGAEYRQEAAAFEPDQNLGTGNDLGFGQSAPVHGSYNVKEGFAEVRIPVVEGMPFFQLLQFDGGYRYASYNLAGPNTTYKYGGEWSPTDDFRLRASVERAVRAPNISELFSANSDSANPGQDPCSADNGGITTTSTLCINTGVPSGSVGSSGLNCPAGQCEARVGGNKDLKPEIADTRTAGIVFTPTFFDGFTATIDYYNIKVDKFISSIPLETILNGCYSTTLNPGQTINHFCMLVHRNAAGEIFGEPVPPGGFVSEALTNVALYQVKGWDMEANYQTDLSNLGMASSWGGIALSFRGSLMNSSDFQPDKTTPVEDCVGLFGNICVNGAPTPRWKHTLRTTWFDASNDVSISLDWRHISSEEFDNVPFNGYPTDGISAHIPAFNWFDLSGTWSLGDGIDLRAGVTNIFDKKPPLVDSALAPASADNGNTFPGTYDAAGRFIFVGGSVKF